MIAEVWSDSGAEFLRHTGIDQKLPGRGRSTHANSCDDHLYLTRRIIVNACDDRVVVVDGPVLQLEIETPIPLRWIHRIDNPELIPVNSDEVETQWRYRSQCSPIIEAAYENVWTLAKVIEGGRRGQLVSEVMAVGGEQV
jgi:hypothetical protein